jgi:cullin 1
LPATEQLYNRYQTSINKYLNDKVVPSLKKKDGDLLLLEAVKRWRDHRLIIKYLERVFQYLVFLFCNKIRTDIIQNTIPKIL